MTTEGRSDDDEEGEQRSQPTAQWIGEMRQHSPAAGSECRSESMIHTQWTPSNRRKKFHRREIYDVGNAETADAQTLQLTHDRISHAKMQRKIMRNRETTHSEMA
jgi:hypothetical protein